MERRDLGTSGLRITPVGIGTWAMGGSGWGGTWGEQDDAESIAVIRAGIEGGANWIDTAPVYGLGHAEEVVGRALKQLSGDERPLVFTKCGFEWEEGDPDSIRQNIAPQRIRDELEACLRRLDLDSIDLFQVHWPDLTTPGGEAVPLEESWGALAQLADEGKVRAIGVSNFTVEQLDRCEAIRHVDSIQPPFSLIGRTAMSDVIPWAREHGTGVIAYSPMQSGLLTDGASLERVAKFEDGDWRIGAPEFTSPRLERNLALRDALKPIAARHGCSVAAVAVAWVAGVPGVTGAIVGGRSATQAHAWLAGGSVQLTDADRVEIDAALAQTRAGEDWTVYPNPGG
ncbi:MAG TPA: aldo/keto reductase [Conexibacter sp.]|nr:aldo/keto reductase [Conexibacter sp.]